MHIIYQCPACQTRTIDHPEPPTAAVQCAQCGWTRDEGAQDFETGSVCRCRICGCQDLWRQKDFPPALGLTFVVMGIILSSMAWANHLPEVAIGILMGFAFVDLLLYTFMGDMLVCYRCRARHRKAVMDEQHPRFSLETAERYRQQELRQREQARG